MSEWCFKNKKEVYLEDAESDFGRYVFRPLTLPDGKVAKALMCFPVYHLEKLTGTLCIISFIKNAFEPFHRDMIGLLLPFVGVAINNAFNHEQILDLKKRAERSEQFMQVFLANMSHEIRTPMNAVMGMTNLLLQKDPQPEQLKYLNTIQRSSENLLVILNDILDLSKIEAGKIEIEKIDFSIADAIDNVRDLIHFKAEEKGLSLDIDVDRAISPVLVGDPTRLTQILLNLMGNAVKFTEKGRVRLTITKLENIKEGSMTDESHQRELLYFEISDTGIGMNDEQQRKLFQNYTQASTETSRKYGGTGLGLSISRQLVRLHGGTIQIESSPGKGSIFSFSISYPVSTNKTKVQKENTISEDMLEELSGIRILLVDDNEYNRIVVRETLELKIKNITVDEANDGLIALEMLKQNKYDLLMMDLVMPNLNGLETTQRIRREFGNDKKSIPIIAITASVLKSEINKCYEAGMNGFIPKPFKTAEVIGAIYKALFDKGANVESETDITQPTNTNKLIDLAYVDDINAGDTDRIKRHRELFILKGPEVLTGLKAALKTGEIEKVRIASHSLKSILKSNGILTGFEVAEQIELNSGTDANVEALNKLIDELDIICTRATEDIKGLIG